MRLPVGLHKLKALLALLAVFVPVNCFAIALDPTFGNGGKVTATFTASGTPSSFGYGVFIQQSGRIIIVGTHQEQGTNSRTNGIGIMALNSAGAIDPSYGTAGRVVVWSRSANYNLFDRTMLSDGSVMVLGRHFVSAISNQPVLLKFRADGKPDPAFKANLDLFPAETNPLRMSLGSGGKIYVLVRRSAGEEYFLIRLLPDGSRDPEFGIDGVRPISFARLPNRQIAGIHEREDGKVIVAGTDRDGFYFEGRAFAARFNSDGFYDRSFGLQGIARITSPYRSLYSTRSLIQPDGKILGVGTEVAIGSNAMLVRYMPRGRPDPGFGTDGLVLTSFNNINIINDLLLSDDKIYVVGSCSLKAIPQFEKLFIARFSSSGVRESFLVTEFFAGRDAGGDGIARQADGKLVAVGFTRNPGDDLSRIAVARFTP